MSLCLLVNQLWRDMQGLDSNGKPNLHKTNGSVCGPSQWVQQGRWIESRKKKSGSFHRAAWAGRKLLGGSGVTRKPILPTPPPSTPSNPWGRAP